MSAVKKVLKIVESKWQSEGLGARVRRSIGRRELTNLDPFLLLDEFEGNGMDGAGFPDHPHRGFETVTYLLEGEFIHEDFTGKKGILKPGDLQWMTAGKGIVHSEMPGSVRTRGLQLWVNLGKDLKMTQPQYQELKSEEITEKTENDVTVKIIAGKSMGVSSQVRTRTPTYYLDFVVGVGASYSQKVPRSWTTFAYILEGELRFGSEAKQVLAHHTVVLDPEGDVVTFKNVGSKSARFILIAGQPLNEPYVQQGPFVMNTREELRKAIEDYTQCKNGFELARNWKSVEGNK